MRCKRVRVVPLNALLHQVVATPTESARVEAKFKVEDNIASITAGRTNQTFTLQPSDMMIMAAEHTVQNAMTDRATSADHGTL